MCVLQTFNPQELLQGVKERGGVIAKMCVGL